MNGKVFSVFFVNSTGGRGRQDRLHIGHRTFFLLT
jgi:hypothetical protein